MTKKARLWIGVTIMALLLFNYASFMIPLSKRSSSLEDRLNAIMVKQFNSGKLLKNSEDDYIIGILKKERTAVSGKIDTLNLAAASLGIIIASWTMFGLIGRKKGG